MKTELLAPAGDFERLKIAFLYGADAVYFGGKDFGLRANAQNFSLDEIGQAVVYAHRLCKKVYVTVNIVFHDKDIEGLDTYIKALNEHHVDAIIFSDPLVLEMAKSLGVTCELHLSTQASALNYETAKFWKSEGVSRVVLAREASREDIIRIKKETGLDLECFIHGAMCTSFSGRCVLSNYCTNRDSNRGGCAQICRWMFDASYEEPFSMTPKDLNMVPHIKDMIENGVNSFKVEGRMRSIYYIATVMYVYRILIDSVLSNNLLSPAYINYYLNILNRCANRDSTPQFYQGLPGEAEQYFLGRQEFSNQDFLGMVLAYDDKTKEALIEQRNYFKVGDVVEFFGPNTSLFTQIIGTIKDEKGVELELARHPQMIVKIPVDKGLEPYDMMRIKVFDKPDEM